MAESGGAERIANTLINRFGKKRVHWSDDVRCIFSRDSGIFPSWLYY